MKCAGKRIGCARVPWARGSAARRLVALLGAALLPVLPGLGACSLPFPVVALKPSEPALADPESTGALPATPVAAEPRRARTLAPELGEEDWRRARAALGVALDPQGNGRPVKWENADSGVRGTINPVRPPFVQADEICRDFLASITGPGFGRFVRGTGCRPSGGAWELKSVRPSKPAA